VARLFTLPKDHPIHGVLERAVRRMTVKGNNPRLPLAQLLKTMDIAKLQSLEKIDPRPMESRRTSTATWIEISADKDHAKRRAKELVESSIHGCIRPKGKRRSGGGNSG
jgi:hypothetical protein